MSASEYGLVQLRQEMAQGREDAQPGTSLQNKAEGYWVPLQQVQQLLHSVLSCVTVYPAQQCWVEAVSAEPKYTWAPVH